jgi:hypothetical protein
MKSIIPRTILSLALTSPLPSFLSGVVFNSNPAASKSALEYESFRFPK